jgi:hypothetical protein
MCGSVGDDVKSVFPVVYSDADFAGCEGKHSTSGTFCYPKGKNTFFPITARSKRQTCTDTSTTEAKLTAAQAALQKQGLPIQMSWEVILDTYGRTNGLYVLFDNSPMLEIIHTARNLTMRHLPKAQGISVAWLYEVCSKPNVHTRYITTSTVAADPFTKFFTDNVEWFHLCHFTGLFSTGPTDASWPDAYHAKGMHQIILKTIFLGSHRPVVTDERLMPPGFAKPASSWDWHDGFVFRMMHLSTVEPHGCSLLRFGSE